MGACVGREGAGTWRPTGPEDAPVGSAASSTSPLGSSDGSSSSGGRGQAQVGPVQARARHGCQESKLVVPIVGEAVVKMGRILVKAWAFARET